MLRPMCSTGGCEHDESAGIVPKDADGTESGRAGWRGARPYRDGGFRRYDAARPVVSASIGAEVLMAQKLTGQARADALRKLAGWSEVAGRDAISKKFVFKDFN